MNAKFSLLVFAAIVLGCCFVHGQAISAIPVAVNQNGAPLGSTLVTVCTSNPGSGTCATPVTLYTDITLTIACTGTRQPLNNQNNPLIGAGCSNPGFTDAVGNVVAFANNGSWWCQFSGPTIATSSVPCPVGGGTGSRAATDYGVLGVQQVGNGSLSFVKNPLGNLIAGDLSGNFFELYSNSNAQGWLLQDRFGDQLFGGTNGTQSQIGYSIPSGPSMSATNYPTMNVGWTLNGTLVFNLGPSWSTFGAPFLPFTVGSDFCCTQPFGETWINPVSGTSQGPHYKFWAGDHPSMMLDDGDVPADLANGTDTAPVTRPDTLALNQTCLEYGCNLQNPNIKGGTLDSNTTWSAIHSGTAVMTTSAIANGACGATVTVPSTGVLATDVVAISGTAAIAANPGILEVKAWATAGNVNVEYCNGSGGSVTPTATTLGWVTLPNASAVTTVTLHLTVNGTGTGSVTDNLGQINCPGDCDGAYPSGTSITLTANPTAGSSFAASGGTGSDNCTNSSPTLTCTFTITTNSTGVGTFTAAGGAIPPIFMGIDTNSGTLPIAGQIDWFFLRLWDSPNGTWPFYQTAACTTSPCMGVFSFSGLDSFLAQTFNAGALQVSQVMGRTPSFASGAAGVTNTGDYTCNYSPLSGTGGSGSSAPGQCDPPTDVNANGSGTDQFMRDFIGAYFAHVNGLDDPNCPSGPTCYTKTHAHVGYPSPWNEVDNNPFWNTSTGGSFGHGTFDQLGRFTVDLHFIVKGDEDLTWNCTSVNNSGVYSCSGQNSTANYYKGQHVEVRGFTGCTGNNISNAVITASSGSTFTVANTTTSCSTGSPTIRLVNPYTGEDAATVQAAVRSFPISGPIDPTVKIATVSGHAPSGQIPVIQAYLYCTGGKATGSNCQGPGVAPFIDAVDIHQKYGNQYAGSQMWLTTTADSWAASILGILQPPEQQKINFNSEGGFAGTNYCTVGNPTSGCGGPYALGTAGSENPSGDLNQAAYQVADAVYQACKGINIRVWYDWHSGNLGSNAADKAFKMVSDALVGSTGISCSISANGTGDAAQPSLVKATLTLSDGTPAMFVWDGDNTGATASGTYFDTGAPNNLECHSSTCPTLNQSITTAWQQKSYIDVTGTQHTVAGSPTTHTYGIGIQPILIQNK